MTIPNTLPTLPTMEPLQEKTSLLARGVELKKLGAATNDAEQVRAYTDEATALKAKLAELDVVLKAENDNTEADQKRAVEAFANIPSPIAASTNNEATAIATRVKTFYPGAKVNLFANSDDTGLTNHLRSAEYETAFCLAMRGDSAMLRSNVLNQSVPSKGGYLIPTNVLAIVNAYVVDQHPIIGLVSQIQVFNAAIKIPLAQRPTATATRIGEVSDDPAEVTLTLTKLALSPTQLTVIVPVSTQLMMNLGNAALMSWVGEQLAQALSAKLAQEILIGGSLPSSPQGILTTISSIAKQTVTAGAVGIIDFSDLANLKGLCKKKSGTVYVINPELEAELLLLKDTSGRQFINPTTATTPTTIYGVPVVWDDSMPKLKTTGQISVLYGDMKAYMLASTGGVTTELYDKTIETLRNEIVHIKSSMWNDGGILNNEAFMVLKHP